MTQDLLQGDEVAGTLSLADGGLRVTELLQEWFAVNVNDSEA